MSYFAAFEKDSTLILEAEYCEESNELTIWFKKYFVDHYTYIDVPLEVFIGLTEAKSKGRFYLNYIKKIFHTKNQKTMADKVIKCKINVMDVHKDWLFQGAKGTYLNFTVLYNEEKDQYGNNGMLVQDVPTEIYKQDKSTKGVILGNCIVFENKRDEEAAPGKENGTLKTNLSKKEQKKADEDLPF